MIQKDFNLKAFNTFGIEAKTAFFFEYGSVEELREGLASVDLNKVPVFIMGTGSNLLFVNDYYNGLILHSRMETIEVLGEDENTVYVKAGSGVEWDDLVAWTVERNYGGLENLSLIPGQVGATPVQNIGAYGVEVKDVLYNAEAIELLSGEKRVFSNKDCEFAYRDSVFKNRLRGKYIFTSVVFKLSKFPVLNLSYGRVAEVYKKYPEGGVKAVRKAVIEIRESKLPDTKKLGNAGSFFKNPVLGEELFRSLQKQYPAMPYYESGDQYKVPAAWMIDQCGLKGFRKGNVGVHVDQPLVLVNFGGASGKEILELANMIIAKVKARFNVELYPEVNFIA